MDTIGRNNSPKLLRLAIHISDFAVQGLDASIDVQHLELGVLCNGNVNRWFVNRNLICTEDFE